MKKRVLIALVVALALAAIASLVWANMGGLVSYWPFDEEDGTTAQDAVNGNHGTLTNMSPPGCWVSGKFGNALSFDGANDYVNCGAAVDNTIATGATLEAWIKPAVQKHGGIISNDLTYGSKKGYDFFLWDAYDPYGRLYIDFGNGTAYGRTWWAIPGADWYGQWHHVAATWDGSTVKLYVDGSEVGTAASLSGPYSDPAKDTLIGGIYYGALPYCPFEGLIDEVRIWNRALTPAEIAYNYALADVVIDIKPGSDPNSINLGSKGVIPVAILSSDIFDATQVDPDTVSLAGAGVAVRGKSNKSLAHHEFVNGDGLLDLVVQVETENLDPTAFQDGVVILEGRMFDGLPFRGQDEIVIVPPE